MNKELKELLEKINKKKQEVKDLVKAGELDKAEEAKNELKTLQREFDLTFDLYEEDQKTAKDQKDNLETAKTAGAAIDTAAKVVKAFGNAIKARFTKTALSEEDAEVMNAMKEGTDEDGGLIVPQDIRTDIKELRRAGAALENYVNVEYVTTNKGTRVIEVDAENTPFDNVEEEGEFGEEATPQFESIKYEIKKKGGILKISRELLQDTAEKIIAYLKKWISKKSRATRNALIINKIKEITKDAEIAVSNLDDLKDIFNVKLDPDIALSSKVTTNQDGFNWLDKLKDSDGRYILQRDPSEATKRRLFGEYEVVKLSNKTLKSKVSSGSYVIPIICGDLKEAITLFDREKMTIDISNVAGDLWKKDQTGIKVRERLDCQAVDEDAIIMGEVTVKLDTDGNGKYSKEELEAMTVEQIKAVAESLSYKITKTKKDEIITEFLTAQGE